jgi:hypothetical protein
MAMSDNDILHRISQLVDEEHHLERDHMGAPISNETRDRLQEVQVQLDQCWDLLRQRQARRSVSANPDDAAVRPESVVENYRQ